MPDTVQALAALGGALWTAHAAVQPERVSIGITGSNGKTSTKELVARLLEAAEGPEAVLATAGNLNNHIGLPITLSRLAPVHRRLVLEMGASIPGDIAHLVGIAPIDRAVVTSIAPAHLEGLGTEADVAQEKGSIFRGMPAPQLAVVPSAWREALLGGAFPVSIARHERRTHCGGDGRVSRALRRTESRRSLRKRRISSCQSSSRSDAQLDSTP